MARILVTGSRGSLGRPLVNELKKRGHCVWQCDIQHVGEDQYIRADVCSFRQLERVFEASPYDFVYHLAAEFGRMNGEEYYDDVWTTNAIGTKNILEFQRRKEFKLIFSSSSEIYGDFKADLLSEDIPMESPIFPANDYAISKWVNELQIMNAEKRYHLPIMRARFFNAYGPGEYYHFYRSVVCLFCYRALNDLPYQVYKNYHRVFMYIDDFIPTLANCAERFKAGDVYNIGGEEYRSVEDLSRIVLAYLGKTDSMVEYLPEDKHNTVNKRPDVRKAKRDLGHSPLTTLEEGIPKTIEWMKRTYPVKRRGVK